MFLNIFGKCCRNTRLTQYLTVIIAASGLTITSSYISWPSPTIPKLTSEDSPLGRPLSSEETSWIVSCYLLTDLPTAMIYTLTIAKLGKKQIMQMASVVLLLPWFLIIFATDVVYIYVGRSIAGLVLGLTVITVSMYISEVADPDIRGRLGTMITIMRLIGSTIILSTGPYVSYQVLSIICASIPLTFFICLFFIPESPYFLVKTNRMEEARETIEYLSGTEDPKIIESKLEEISIYLQSTAKPLSIMEVLSNRIYMKVIGIVLTVINLDYFGGAIAIAAYQQTIIERSDNSALSPELSSIVFGLIQIPSALLSAYLVDKLGRKIIIYIGGIGSAIALTAEGIYFFLEETKVLDDMSTISWIPTTALVVFQVMHSMSGSVTYILLGELFIDKIKNVATMLYLMTGVGSVFLVSKTFEPMANAWGLYTVFWFFACCTFALVIFVYFFLPETKGKTFVEIERDIYK